MEKVCFVCLQPSRLKCSRCDAIQYCGKECQKKDWKVHKHNCRDNNYNVKLNTELDTHMVILNKALNYAIQGNYHRAEKSCRKLLEPAVRSRHAYNFQAKCLVNLSQALYNQGKFAEAVEIARESLDICRSSLSSSDPETLQTMETLAASYTNLRRFDRAYKLLNECIETSTVIYGKYHDHTISYQSSLGYAYIEDGRHNQGQKLLHECLALTKNDDKKYEIMGRLASIYELNCQYEEAEELCKECLEKLRLIKGENHPDTISMINNLAYIYEKQNKPLDQIEAIRKEFLVKSIVINGKHHPDTLTAMCNLATSYLNQGKLDEAAQLFKECFEKRISILGRNHPDTLSAMEYHAETYLKQRRYNESIKLNRECLERRKIILGENHPDTLKIMFNLGLSYSKLGKFDESLSFFKDCYDIRCMALGADHVDTLSCAECINKMHQLKDKLRKAS